MTVSSQSRSEVIKGAYNYSPQATYYLHAVHKLHSCHGNTQ